MPRIMEEIMISMLILSLFIVGPQLAEILNRRLIVRLQFKRALPEIDGLLFFTQEKEGSSHAFSTITPA